jgi:hypothetical protein
MVMLMQCWHISTILLEAGDQVHIRIWNAMLRACCFHNASISLSTSTIRCWLNSVCEPNTYTYLSIINGLGASNVYERAVDFVYTLRNARMCPSMTPSYRSIMSTAAQARRYGQLFQVLSRPH